MNNEHTIDAKVGTRDDGSERWIVLYRFPADSGSDAAACLRNLIDRDPCACLRLTYRRDGSEVSGWAAGRGY